MAIVRRWFVKPGLTCRNGESGEQRGGGGRGAGEFAVIEFEPDSGHIKVVLQRAVRYVPPMGSLPFDKLPPHKPRRFVPQAIDLGDWTQISPLFDELHMCALQSDAHIDLE